MKNYRGAGRKPILNSNELNTIVSRVKNGESVQTIANEYGMSRQALYKRIKTITDTRIIKYDYVVDGEITTSIEIDVKSELLNITNYTHQLSKLAFGTNNNPNWNDLGKFFEGMYLSEKGLNIHDSGFKILGQDNASDYFDVNTEEGDTLRFEFTKKDILYARTSTDGFQLKALSRDRKWFVKAQAVITGVVMDDWAVELIASDICRQLGIRCVEQKRCKFIFGDREYDAVFAPNFELDGYTFISFERLVERNGYSINDSEFIKLDAIGKLEWCATQLAASGGLCYEDTFKYMLEMAIVDCLVGNIDRHTKNFGLFYNVYSCKYEIPLIFDNGMGLFENDPYKNEYKTFDDAMRNVYVAPYGEDPFEFLESLIEKYDLFNLYPALCKLDYSSEWSTPFAKEYCERIKKICQR